MEMKSTIISFKIDQMWKFITKELFKSGNHCVTKTADNMLLKDAFILSFIFQSSWKAL